MFKPFNYESPAFAEREDSGMNRVYGAAGACVFIKKRHFEISKTALKADN